MEARQHLLNQIINLRLMVNFMLLCALVKDLVKRVVLCAVVPIVYDPAPTLSRGGYLLYFAVFSDN